MKQALPPCPFGSFVRPANDERTQDESPGRCKDRGAGITEKVTDVVFSPGGTNRLPPWRGDVERPGSREKNGPFFRPHTTASVGCGRANTAFIWQRQPTKKPDAIGRWQWCISKGTGFCRRAAPAAVLALLFLTLFTGEKAESLPAALNEHRSPERRLPSSTGRCRCRIILSGRPGQCACV